MSLAVSPIRVKTRHFTNPIKGYGWPLLAVALMLLVYVIGVQWLHRAPPLDPRSALHDPILPLVGRPDFDPGSLPAEQRIWYDRLWTAIRNPEVYPNPDTAASSGDLYPLGRTLNDHITALLTAFRVTGDLALLDEVDRLMELARAQLQDYNNDGYLNWRWLWDNTQQIYYNTDDHEMDEMLTHALVAEVAYALHANAEFSPVYAEHAAFWTDYLINHFLAKWKERGGLDRPLTHPYTQFMRMYYYLYRLTGDEDYLAEAFRRARVLDTMMQERQTPYGVAFVWDHRVPGMGIPAYGCQPTVYSQLTMAALQDLALEGFAQYADPDYMRHYTATFRDLVIRANNLDTLAGTVCGDGEESFGKFLISNMPGLAVWDDTGQILAVSEAAYRNSKVENPNNPRRVFIPAYMLQALAAQP
ncbi:MAG: hypothetical protein GXY36_12025 [Chloroflexi bacterium]|nr:hypothetical protein [Chloroflexota bacterium]